MVNCLLTKLRRKSTESHLPLVLASNLLNCVGTLIKDFPLLPYHISEVIRTNVFQIVYWKYKRNINIYAVILVGGMSWTESKNEFDEKKSKILYAKFGATLSKS